MTNVLARILKDLVTTKDGESQDLGRWSWICSSLAVVGAGVWNALQGETFDLVQVATALGIVAGAHGAALWAKSSTEPNAEKKAN
jgi:hypothetical protein